MIDWLPKIINFFKPFRPEITHFQINYNENKAVIYYQYPLSSHRYFQVVLSGYIEEQALKNIIRIQPTINRNSTPSYDRYWLDVMIRDIDTLEKIYHSLEINQINLSVRVATERYFTIELPKSLTRSLRIINEFLLAGKGRDRNLLFKKWKQYRLAPNIDKDEIIKYFEDLTNNINLINFIKIDPPFYTGKIGDFETHRVIPSSFLVEAVTDLSFRKPAASGYLEFHKKNFQDAVRSEIKENWGNQE